MLHRAPHLPVLAGLLGVTLSAHAQSDGLLEAVRLHAPDARATADAELAACLKAGCEAAPRLTLLAAYLALSDGDAARAWTLLEDATVPDALEPWHRYYLGEAAFYRRDYAHAAKAFAQVAARAPASLRNRAVARLGESWLWAGQPATALPFLEEATTALGTPELYFQRARAREAVGKHDGARADWVLLAVKFPAHPYGEEAVAILSAQKPRYRFSFEERLARAEALVNAAAPERALAELEAIDREKLARGATARARQARVHALALLAQRHEQEAEPFLDAATKGPRALAAEVAMIRARRALRRNDRQRARELFAAAATKYPKERVTEDGLYLAAWIDLQEDRYADAVKTFDAFARQRPRSRKLDEALWFKALAQLRMKDYPAVRDTLGMLQARFPRSSLVPQAKYWATRAAQLAGEKPELVAPEYEAVIDAFPGSFYAVLSQARLEELGRKPPPAFPQRPTTLEKELPKELLCALALTRAGLFRDAHDEVEAQLSRVRDPQDALVYGHALQQLGQYGPAYALAARLLWGSAFGEKKPEAVALLYPRAFRTAVEREAERQRISASLVWAIMRRESAFRPEVASPADARGLMQLIPPTAKAIARALGDDAPAPDALFAPEVNIRYATWYLAQLKERFGHPALVAAAYNAGPAAVLRWVKADRTLPLDLFVELIPFKETRGYVKQVVADYCLYQQMYAEGDVKPSVAMTLPEPKAEGVDF
ncbi:MAG: transglycosylase SLT domain-containing protein [Myxococcaceae bacterium]|nr:transglycosylase SLT domain-containing protein [Myxococcaceae bacterium]